MHEVGETADGATVAPSAATAQPASARVPARWLPTARVVWALLAIMALATVVGGSWRAYVQALQIDPAWNRLGLYTDYPDSGGFDVNWLVESVEAAGVVDGSRLVAVEGRRVDPDASEEDAARLIAGPDGTLRLTLRAPDGKVSTVTLRRSSSVAGKVSVVSDLTFFLMSSGMGTLAALVLLTAAAMLAHRRFADRVSYMLSVTLLLLVIGLPVGVWWWMWFDLEVVSDVAVAGFVALFIAAVPMFPDGTYRPRAGRWIAYAGLPVGLGMLTPDAEEGLFGLIALVTCLIAALFPLLRFRSTPRGLERQQLKWVGAGFFGAAVTLGFSAAAMGIGDSALLPDPAASYVRLTGIAMQQWALMLLPIGLLVSLLRFRLWDADAVIGRSAGWAILTLVAGAVWAGSTALIDEAIKGTIGAGADQGMAAAASTIFAVLVLGPAHERVVGWMDARFRANILRLRELPQRLSIWQHGDTPEDIGARVVDAVCRTLHTDQAALLLHTANDGYRVVGRRGVTAEGLDDWIEANLAEGRLCADRVARGDTLFPLRLVLDDGGIAIGALLLGRRSDGSLYAKDERGALDALETPLAAALRQAQRRRASETRVAALISEIETRLQGLERGQAA